MYERKSPEVELAEFRARLDELVRTRRPSDRTRAEWKLYHDLQRDIRSRENTIAVTSAANAKGAA